MLRAFLVSLTGAASRWLRNKPTGSITTWEDLKTKFLSKYCPPARTTKKMEEINNFQQEPEGNLYQAWERFKELLMKCPKHCLTKIQEVVLFYYGLDVPTRQILDSSGAIPSKIAADAKIAIQEMAEYSQKWHNATSRVKRPHYTKDCPLKEEGKTLEEAYYTKSIEDTMSKFMSESTKRHKENSNLIREIRAATDAAIRNQGASIKTLEIQIGQMSKLIHIRYAVLDHPNTPRRGELWTNFAEAYGASHINNIIPQKEKDPGSFTLPCFINNVCFDNALVDLGASVSVIPLLTYLNLGLSELAHTRLTVELADKTVKYPKGIAENVLVGIGKFTFPIDFIILDMLEDIKVPLILERPFLFIARAKINVYKRKITLRVGEENIIFKSVKPASSLIKMVYMISLRERMELDLEARLMGETLVLNRSLDSFLEDYIKLNDLNKPFELRRNQGDNLMPTIEEGEVIEEFRTRYKDLDIGIDDYTSYCDSDKKIHIDCTHNLKFSCMIGFEFTHVNFFPLLYVNVMSKKFHNSIMKDKMVYKRNNVVGALMNVPIFVGTFFVVSDFAVLEDMDTYRDEGMGDVIVGEPFLREVGIKAKRFDGMITIYNGNVK
ncbi:hypothetical protein Tco_0703544 [Tanacetum coccineum]|uniref:Retrotransposon gag domain-containing protein n=1 Tax=Tanacetum coccineum TaxID=301880 RepID=A0ABQ4Y0P3_9ASTR